MHKYYQEYTKAGVNRLYQQLNGKPKVKQKLKRTHVGAEISGTDMADILDFLTNPE